MIDVTKCIGCRKGIPLFTKDENGYAHTDLFASYGSGVTYKCENSDIIGDYLIPNGDKGTLLPNEELKVFFLNQEMWWDDIISLIHDVLKDTKLVQEFFNDGEKGNMTWNLSNEEIEEKISFLAIKEGFFINEEDYPDLLMWKLKEDKT
jgi:hypothetical protein